MSIKTSDLKVGDVLHDIHRVKAGNTTMSVEGHWEANGHDPDCEHPRAIAARKRAAKAAK